MRFVNRERELEALDRWWARRGSSLAVLWGRRRVGKTALIQRFAEQRKTIFHTASGRPAADELRSLSSSAAPLLPAGIRDISERPLADWVDAVETLASAAVREPLLLVLDEFPELVEVSPDLPSVLRAVWERVRSKTKLRILLCGSAVRTMEAMQEERAPLYGRLDLRLMLHPFRPDEAARMLSGLSASDRALVWGLVGGMPLYLEWWNQRRSVRQNLATLACTPGGSLLTEGELVLATEGETGDLGRRILYAIAAGRTKFNQIADAVRADPGRVLDRLVALRLVERVVPVTADSRKTRRRIYRIADNFLSFFLGVLDRYRAEIERGLGSTILPVLMQSLDDHMGPIWEEAFRLHLRRLAERGELGNEVVAIGPFWTAAADPCEIDAVVLSGRRRAVTLVGEAKWGRRADGERVRRSLERKVAALPKIDEDLRYAVCAREQVDNPHEVLAVTAAEIFRP
ncbi:MAG: ATP-binding protein [Solirubrobacterales bacterium]